MILEKTHSKYVAELALGTSPRRTVQLLGPDVGRKGDRREEVINAKRMKVTRTVQIRGSWVFIVLQYRMDR